MRESAKTLAIALLVFVVPISSLAAQTSPESPKFTLRIHVVKPVVSLGADVDIEIELTNTSDEPLAFEFGNIGNLAVGYQYEVRDEQGVEVPKGVHHDPLEPGRAPGSSRQGEIRPGKSIGERSRISDSYPFDHPGEYTVRVSRTTPWSPAVYSNVVTITVVASRDSEPK